MLIAIFSGRGPGRGPIAQFLGALEPRCFPGTRTRVHVLDSPAMDRFRRFDEAYYHRFYDSPQTRVTSPEEHANLAGYVFAFAAYNKVEVKSVLDVGAGIGLWKHWIEK